MHYGPRSLFALAVRRRVLFLAALCAGWLLLSVAVQPASADSVVWNRFDVELELLPDGTLKVRERQEISFEGGPFRGAFVAVSFDRVDEISNVRVSEEVDGRLIAFENVPAGRYEEAPETYTTVPRAGELEIDWGYSPAIDERRVFVIEYELRGAVRVYTEGDQRWEQIWWTAISDDVTSVAPVEEASVTLTLPEPANPDLVQLGEDARDDPANFTDDFQTWRWEESGLVDGDELTIRIEFPAMTSAAPPEWQQQDDEVRFQEEQEDNEQALIDLLTVGAGILIALVGGIGLFGYWFGKGRDPQVGAVASFLPEPPDDLPPGAAGALLDEVANERDIVATVVDLGRRGVLKIDEVSEGGRDFVLTLLQPDAPLLAFEQTLLTSLFGSQPGKDATTRLSQANPLFNPRAEAIKTQLYDELVRRGYFVVSPERTRDRWRAGGRAALIILGLGACIGFAVLLSVSVFVLFPLAVLVLLAAVVMVISRYLPQKTLPGAESAAKWEAFRTYLADIEKYDRLSESHVIFDKYLPYAVAFGLEDTWLVKFTRAGAPTPAWYGPVVVSAPGDWSNRRYRPRTSWGGGTWSSPTGSGGDVGSGGSGGGGFDLPDLQSMSDSAGRSLQGSSNSLFDMLNSAAEAFGSFSSSGSGSRHWGSTGGSRRRSGGGFRGGGRRGGSGGGGRRGFR